MDWHTIFWYYVLTLHLASISTTVWLHRTQTHRALTLHPVLCHIMRFVQWTVIGIITNQWVAVHRKHHMFSDKVGDPHSPHQLGIKELLTRGSIHANYVWKDRKMCAMYAPDGPSDWIEKNIYTPYNFAGPLVLIFIETLLFGPVGIFLFFLRLAVYWYLSGSVVNGIGHWWGYRNFETRDQSRNFSPVGLIICGEELHNNHHGDAKNPQFSRKWFEFDIAWIYIRIFLALKLASIPGRSSE